MNTGSLFLLFILFLFILYLLFHTKTCGVKFYWRKVSGAHPPTCVTNLPHSVCCCQQSEENTLGRTGGHFRGELSSAGAQQTALKLPLSPFLSPLAVLLEKPPPSLCLEAKSQDQSGFPDFQKGTQKGWWMGSSKTTPHDAHFLRLNN